MPELQPDLPIVEQRGIDIVTQLQPFLVGREDIVSFPARLEDTTVSTIFSQIRDGIIVVMDRVGRFYFCMNARTGNTPLDSSAPLGFAG